MQIQVNVSAKHCSVWEKKIKVCPLTFVKAKVAIEELEDGEILAVRMNDGEPVQNVPRSMKEEGHKVLKLTDNEDGTYTMYVRKVED